MCRVLFCFVFQFEECQTANNTHDEENKLILWKLMHASPVSERDWIKLNARPHSVELLLFCFINKRHKNVRLHMTCVVAKTCMSNVCAWVYVYVFCDVDSGGCYLQRYALRLLYTVVYTAIPAIDFGDGKFSATATFCPCTSFACIFPHGSCDIHVHTLLLGENVMLSTFTNILCLSVS